MGFWKMARNDKTKVCILGPKGTFSHHAWRQYNFNNSVAGEPLFVDSLHRVIHRVRNDADCIGIVPVRNNIIGDVMLDHGPAAISVAARLEEEKVHLNLIDSFDIELNLSVGGVGAVSEITGFVSMGVALRQCSRFICQTICRGETVAGCSIGGSCRRVVAVNSTVQGIEWLKNKKTNGLAVIADPETIHRSGLKVVREHVSDKVPAITTFGVIAAKAAPVSLPRFLAKAS